MSKPPPIMQPSSGGEASQDSAADAYAQLWQTSPPPDLEAFLAANPSLSPAALCSVLRVDLRQHWENGEQVYVEEYFKKYPLVAENEEIAVDLIYSEYLLRERLGAAPTAAEYAGRFPALAEHLAAQIELHRIADESASGETLLSRRAETRRGFTPPAAEFDSLVGQLGRYQIERLVGRGGMGSVYLARDSVLERPVAIKVPRLEHQDPAAVERFYREARAAARVDHPHLCTVYDVDEIEGRLFIAMQYVPGETLADLLRRCGTLSVRRAAELTIQLARALEAAHQAGILHRDLKPGNIILNAAGDAIVMDFGLAQLHSSEDSRITHSGTFVGTPAYASPEQLVGETKSLTPASDVYSLGVILFHMLTGRPPFEGSLATVMKRALVDPPPPIEQLRSGVPDSLTQICNRALSKEPAARFSTMGELAEALQRIVSRLPDDRPSASNGGRDSAGETTLLSDVQLVAEQQRNPSSAIGRRRWAWGLGIAALALAALLAAPWLLNPRLNDSRVQPGTHWQGRFAFSNAPDAGGEVWLEITRRDGDEVAGVYNTESRFEWELAGTVRNGRVDLKFMRVIQGEQTAHLLEFGKLTGTVRGKVLDLVFEDASDGSHATMRLLLAESR